MLFRRSPTLKPPLRRQHSLAALCAMLGAIGLLGAGGQSARAAELEGLRFDDATRVGGKELQLNGLGLRSVFIVKGYVAALYLPERARNAALVLSEKGPKRLQIRPLAKLDANALVKAVDQGIRDNHSVVQAERFNDRLAQFQGAMTLVGTTHKGDVLNLDFLPESGTVIAINGIPRGRPIPGDDFYQAMLRIFLGDKPMDRELKRGLLGG